MFLKAIPVFMAGEREFNRQLILRAKAENLAGAVLSVAAADFYRLWVNGKFVAFGPARTTAGYARVDEIALGRYNKRNGENEIVIEVAGYACKSLSTVQQDSFAIAELRRGDEVLLATGKDFEGYRSPYRVQKCERFSGQRHFGEVWDLTAKTPFVEEYRVALCEVKTPVFLSRVAPYPTYERILTDKFSSMGRFTYRCPKDFRANRYSFAVDKAWGCYGEDEVPHPYRFVQNGKMTHERGGNLPLLLSAGQYVLFDMKKINVGFFEWSAKALEECEVVLAFSELCSPRKFAFTNINMQPVIEYRIPEGRCVDTMSFEPYTARFAVLMVKKGALCLTSFAMRTFEHDRARLLPRKIKDKTLRKIYAAAERTFVHNALDLYTDCPSRERAGWLCDSYFTGRVEYFLTGKTDVEDAFLENYRLYRATGELPEGALPMCYPADIQEYEGKGKWIPQWNMWYVLEVCEYLTDRRPDVDKELFRPSVYGFLHLMAKYENADGLLQDLPSWNFVEWSTANEWVKNVNYPTNFLYAEVLDRAGCVFGDAELCARAARVRQKTAALSFDGELFIDNAVFDGNGTLKNTRNFSEAGQYYALLFGGLDLTVPQYQTWVQHAREGFANFDLTDQQFVEVNAFIGLYLRIWWLMESGERTLLEKNIKEFFSGMVASTGTLWEYKQKKGSFDHGFASFAALAIDYIENTPR